MIIASSFIMQNWIDLIILAGVFLFVIGIIIGQMVNKNKFQDNYSDKYFNINKDYDIVDSRYKASDILVETYHDEFIEDIDRSIKDMDIEAFNEDFEEETAKEFEDEHVMLEEDTMVTANTENSIINDEPLTTGQDFGLSSDILKSYWVKMSSMLKTDLDINKFALLEKDEDGLFNVIKNVGFTMETVELLKFTEYDRFYKNFFKHNKNLYITNDAFLNEELYKMFSEDDQNNIGELLFFPVVYSTEVIGILCCARDKGLAKLDKDILLNKIVQQSKF